MSHDRELPSASVGVWEHSLEPALAGTPEGTLVVADVLTGVAAAAAAGLAWRERR
jgi:hypothetical protein